MALDLNSVDLLFYSAERTTRVPLPFFLSLQIVKTAWIAWITNVEDVQMVTL